MKYIITFKRFGSIANSASFHLIDSQADLDHLIHIEIEHEIDQGFEQTYLHVASAKQAILTAQYLTQAGLNWSAKV